MQSLRVLLVEDAALLAMAAELVLEDEGHEVVGIAADAADAFRLAEKTRPDLAIVDINLRDGMTGPRIGATFARRYNIPVLFATADPSNAPVKTEGVLGVITKPYAPEDLARIVRVFASRPSEDWACLSQHLREGPSVRSRRATPTQNEFGAQGA
jgi:CheY-like chemotaxis protein